MKEEINFTTFLYGFPYEMFDFAAHLKTLSYSDEPNYHLLENALKSIIVRHAIPFDEPFDWEINYENLGPRIRVNGAPAAKNRSHTTALKDRLPEEKNRALDTQAPLTMGEEDDERTGAHQKLNKADEKEQQQHDKPKYKRQEFMRPKYGAVNFDAINAVNARLAAAACGPADVFEKLHIDVSLDDDKNFDNANNDNNVQATIQLPQKAVVNGINLEPITSNMNDGKSYQTLPPATARENKIVKINRSLTLPNNKKLCGSKKVTNQKSSVNQTFAQAELNGPASSYLEAPTIASRWVGSFDGTHNDGVDQSHVDESEANGSRRSPLFFDTRHTGVRPFSRTGSLSSMRMSNTQLPVNCAAVTRTFAPPTTLSPAKIATIAVTPPQVAKTTASHGPTLLPTSQVTSASYVLQSAPTVVTNSNSVNVHSGSTSLMAHFKNLVNTFNSLGNSAGTTNSPRRPVSHGCSFDNGPLSYRRVRAYFNADNNERDGNTSAVICTDQMQPVSSNSSVDHDKELRRQRRFRRRSDCQGMINPFIELQRKNSTTGINDNRTGDSTNSMNNELCSSDVAISPSYLSTVKKCSSEIRLLNNGNEVPLSSDINQAIEGSKRHMQYLRQKRYQFLGLTPPSRTTNKA